MIRLHDFPEDRNLENRFNDGKCDPSGRLWVGTMNKNVLLHAGKLYCFDGITITTKQYGLTFGSDHLKTLYITSAREGLTENQLIEYPLSGGLFYYLPVAGGSDPFCFN